MSGKRPLRRKKLSNLRNCGLMHLVYISVDSDVCSGEYGAIIVIKIRNLFLSLLLVVAKKRLSPAGKSLMERRVTDDDLWLVHARSFFDM